MDQLELLGKLPLPAVLMLGVTFGVMLFVRHFGIRSGEAAPLARKPSTAEVAAVIVDPTALNNATEAMRAHTYEAVNMRKSFERGVEKICDSLDGLSAEVDDLKKEVMRRKA